jgi:hypothetical protein
VVGLVVACALATSVRGAAQGPTRYYMISDLGPGDAFKVQNLQLGYTAGALDLALCPKAAGSRFGFFWDGYTGVRRSFCPLGGDASTEVFDFEMLGAKSAVGYSRSATGNDRPVVWNEQLPSGSYVPQLMALPAGSPGGVAWGTEPLGQVVGELSIGGERRAAYWLIPSFAPTTFPTAGTSAAFSLAGSTFDPVAAVQHQGRFGLWYPRQTPNLVTYPLGATPSVPYRLRQDASRLIAVGQMGAAGSGQGFLWQSDTGVTALPNLLAGSDGAARDFWTTSGIVGYSRNLAGQSRAVLWEGPLTWDLNDLKLPTCRDDNEVACAPWDLETAHSISQGGVIVGSGTFAGEHHAFLARPVELLTWNAAVCAETAQPFCVPVAARTSTELIIDPYEVKQRTPDSSSASGSYATAAQAYIENNGIWIPNASSSFRSYAVFEHKSVMDHLLPGQTSLEVRFHFKVDGLTAGGPGQSLGSVSAGAALRPARNAGEYSSANGSMNAQGGAVTRFGVFAGQGEGSTGDIELPLQLHPFSDDLEVRIEGSVGASTLASGPTWASGDVSVRFCAEDPLSITLPDGTPVADVGIKYTLWPTVRRDPDEDDRCRNPLEELPNDTPICDGGGGAGGNFRIVAPPLILPGERVELQGVGRPPGGTLTATVVSGNATVEAYRPCTTYPDGSAHCPVVVRASPTLGPDAVVSVRLTYSYDGGGSACRFESTATLLGSRLHFVDPIDGDAPALLDPAVPLSAQPIEFLRRDAALMARKGRRVRGLAADGVTPVILRFRAPGPGAVTFTVTDDHASRDQARVGRLADPLASPPVTYVNPVTVPIRQVGTQYWAFAVLTAPLDFVRSAVTGDATLGQDRPRRLPVQVDFAPAAGGGAPFRVTRSLDLVRPPVTLIHGVWSDGGSWKWGLLQDGRFFDYAHDYKPSSGKSYLENYKQAWWGVGHTLEAIRLQGIAATQADVFGHSMGGILSRIYVGGPAYARNRRLPPSVVRGLAPAYQERSNFGAGTIHKLTIIDSPQLGSPLANWVAKRPTVRALMFAFEPRSIGGAVEDLVRGGAGVQALPAVALPVHAMLGHGGGSFVVNSVVSNTPGWVPPLLKVVAALGGVGVAEFLQGQYDPEPDHDVIVGVCSMRAGLPLGPAAAFVTSDFIQSMHTNNTSSSAYNQEAINLLNARVGTTLFAPGLLPPASPAQLCTPQAFARDWAASPVVPQGTGALAAPALAPILEAGLVITYPPEGTVVSAGSDLSVTVEASPRFVPTRIIVVAGSGSELVFGSRFDGQVHIPDTEFGDIQLLALGLDAQDRIAAAVPVVLRVEAPAPLNGVRPLHDSVVLDAATPSTGLQVAGTFGDGVTRDLTSSRTGTTYQSTDPAVATVDAEGVVTARVAGTSLVRVESGGFDAIVEVKVLRTPSDGDGDGDVDVADFVELRACWSGPGEAEGFQAPSNACRDTFDADSDGDVDADDYPAFLARYTGPQDDCNANGELDLTDIVHGTSQDANGNGVPDECEGG